MPRGVVTEESARDHWTKALKKRLVSTDGVTAFSPSDLVGRTRTRLEAELKALQRLMALTYARFNSLSITARLPAEVLMHVFSMLSECDPPGSKPFSCVRSGEKQSLGWINATHVCRRWREVALSAPGLWTNVGAPQTVPWMEEMLVRSKQVPFTLSTCLTLDHRISGFIVRMLGSVHFSRMKGLHLSEKDARSERGDELEVEMDGIREYVLKSLDHAAPMLESLAFKDMKWYSYALPQNVFANTLPRLRRFADNQCYELSYDAPYLRGLTDLDLDFHFDFSSVKLLGLLKELPMLEDLRIGRHGFFDDEHHHDGDPVSLPSLKTFYYYERRGRATCADFLSNMLIPPTARQEIRITDLYAKQTDIPIAPVPTSPVDAGNPSTRPLPSTMRLACDRDARGNTDIIIRAWFSHEEHKTPHLFLRWFVCSSDSPRQHAIILRHILGSLDVHRLTNLSVTSQQLDQDLCSAIVDAFYRTSAVAKLKLGGRGVGPLLSCLENTYADRPDPNGEGIDGDASTHASPFLFPSLHRLWIAELPFDESASNMLVKAIKKRDAWAERVPRLSITGCEGSKPVIRRLRKLVDSMHHDLRK